MNEQQAADLQKMKEENARDKNNTFDYLRMIDRMSARDLETSGYRGKTNAEAMQMAFKAAMKRMEDRTKAFLKKYPDDK